MKTLQDYLDMAKAITGSDGKTAKAIGFTRSAISHCRKTGTMEENNCVRLAALVDVNPADIIATSNVQKYPENRKVWAKWVAAILIVFSGFLFLPQSGVEGYSLCLILFISYYLTLNLICDKGEERISSASFYLDDKGSQST